MKETRAALGSSLTVVSGVSVAPADGPQAESARPISSSALQGLLFCALCPNRPHQPFRLVNRLKVQQTRRPSNYKDQICITLLVADPTSAARVHCLMGSFSSPDPKLTLWRLQRTPGMPPGKYWIAAQFTACLLQSIWILAAVRACSEAQMMGLEPSPAGL